MTYHRNMKMLQFKFLENMKNYKHDKLKLDIAFLNNWKQLGVFMKFLIFKLPIISNHDASSVWKRLLCSTITKGNKEFGHKFMNWA